MPVTKKQVLDHLTKAQQGIRQGKNQSALTHISSAKVGVANLREPASPEPPQPPPAPAPEPAPAPQPPPAPTYPPAAPDIAAYRTITDFSERLLKQPSRAAMIADPAGSGRDVISLTCLNEDTGVTSNPRAQLGGKYILEPETEFWLHTRIYFPEDFPTFDNWMSLCGVWGPPFGLDGGPFHLQTWDGRTLNAERNSTYHDDLPLKMPIVRGQWTDILWHEYLSQDPTKGFVELWRDGTPQTFIEAPGNPTQRLYMKTIDASNSGEPGNVNQSARISVYYAKDSMPERRPVTVLFDGVYLGTTRESVGA